MQVADVLYAAASILLTGTVYFTIRMLMSRWSRR